MGRAKQPLTREPMNGQLLHAFNSLILGDGECFLFECFIKFLEFISCLGVVYTYKSYKFIIKGKGQRLVYLFNG